MSIRRFIRGTMTKTGMKIADKVRLYERHGIRHSFNKYNDPGANVAYCRVAVSSLEAFAYAPPLDWNPCFQAPILEYVRRECPVAYWVVCEGDIIDKWWKDQG